MAYLAIASDIARGAAIWVLIPLAFTFFAIAYKLLRLYRTDRVEYVRNQQRSESTASVIRGDAKSFYDGVRDERVAAGIAVDTKKNEWVEQGKLSEEAVASLLQ
jgi:hypothetical protein